MKKGETRPWMLPYLLVGALLLSTGLNCYFLLRLDARLPDPEVVVPAPMPAPAAADRRSVSLRLPGPPAAPADTVPSRARE